MTDYFICDEDGHVVGGGSCGGPVDVETLLVPVGGSVHEGSARPGQWWDGQQLRDRPPSPGPHHVWDRKAKQWVDPRTLDDIRAQQWARVKAARQAFEHGGFRWGGYVFDSDPASQARLQAAMLQAIQHGDDYYVEWTLKDNTRAGFGGAALRHVAWAMAEHVAQAHAISQRLREQIQSAATQQEIEAVAWPSSS